MSVLSDEKYLEMAHRMATTYRHDADGPGRHHYGFHRHTLLDFARAVAEAAIAADRAARAEPVAWIEFDGASVAYSPNKDAARRLPVGVRFDLYTAQPAAPVVPEEIAPSSVPMHWRDESSNAWAYAAGFNACRRAMLAAAPAPSQDNGGAA